MQLQCSQLCHGDRVSACKKDSDHGCVIRTFVGPTYELYWQQRSKRALEQSHVADGTIKVLVSLPPR